MDVYGLWSQLHHWGRCLILKIFRKTTIIALDVPGEETGGEDDSKDLEEGEAEADDSQEKQVLTNNKANEC